MLEEVADDRRRGGLTGERRGEHQPRHPEPVALDDARAARRAAGRSTGCRHGRPAARCSRRGKASVSTRARLSIVPSMRPLAAASRTASGAPPRRRVVRRPPGGRRRGRRGRHRAPRPSSPAGPGRAVRATAGGSSSGSRATTLPGSAGAAHRPDGATWQVSAVPSVDCGDGRGATVRPRPVATRVLPTMSDDGQTSSANGAARGWDEFEPLYDAHHERLYKLAVLLCHGSEAHGGGRRRRDVPARVPGVGRGSGRALLPVRPPDAGAPGARRPPRRPRRAARHES